MRTDRRMDVIYPLCVHFMHVVQRTHKKVSHRLTIQCMSISATVMYWPLILREGHRLIDWGCLRTVCWGEYSDLRGSNRRLGKTQILLTFGFYKSREISWPAERIAGTALVHTISCILKRISVIATYQFDQKHSLRVISGILFLLCTRPKKWTHNVDVIPVRYISLLTGRV
jgi:hypothetical protein